MTASEFLCARCGRSAVHGERCGCCLQCGGPKSTTSPSRVAALRCTAWTEIQRTGRSRRIELPSVLTTTAPAEAGCGDRSRHVRRPGERDRHEKERGGRVFIEPRLPGRPRRNMTQRSCSWTTLVVEVASGNTQRQDRDEDENDGFAIASTQPTRVAHPTPTSQNPLRWGSAST